MRLPRNFSLKSRKFFYFIHLWTGLILGLWLVLMGLTGSLLSFKYEMLEWEARRRVSAAVPAPDARIIPLSKAVAALEAVDPKLNLTRGIYVPGNQYGYYWLNERGLVNGVREKRVFLVDPVSARVYPPVDRSTLWIEITEQFHHNLLVGVKGTVTNGFFTFFSLFMLISGAWLWWPSNLKQLKQRITLKRSKSLRRTLYDLHNMMGVYFYGLLFVLALTGVIICYNGQTDQSIRRGINRLVGAEDEPRLRRGGAAAGRATAGRATAGRATAGRATAGRAGAGGAAAGRAGGAAPAGRPESGRPGAGRGTGLKADGGREPLPIDTIVEKARAALPGNTLVNIRAPRRPGQPILASYDRFGLTGAGVPFDPYTGARLDSDGNPTSPGSETMGVVFQLHYGWFGGFWCKVIYCLSGFMPLGLFVTGVWMWVRKKKMQAATRETKLQREIARARKKEQKVSLAEAVR